MEKIQHITSIDKFENLSIREICRRTGKHYETVKKYLNKEDWNTELKPKRVYPSKLTKKSEDLQQDCLRAIMLMM